MMFSLEGKTAVVTGSGSGIGRAIAILFAKQGARVVLLDVSKSAADAVASEIDTQGGSSLVVRCDVSDGGSVREAFEAIDRAGFVVDILVNNAGVSHVGTLLSTDEQQFERVLGINVRGVFLCAKAAAPRMMASGGGVILNMASIASVIGLEERFAYSASKGAVMAMTRSIAADYMRAKIRCNCLCPARIHTPFVDDMLKRYYPGREAAVFDELSQAQPIGRMGTPEEVAMLALYLCSDESSFITGQAFPIDGGVLGTPLVKAKERKAT
jgi:NAD(P)-dependent dehydrogenase (short-subunit alcohol dehydrogenase family)